MANGADFGLIVAWDPAASTLPAGRSSPPAPKDPDPFRGRTRESVAACAQFMRASESPRGFDRGARVLKIAPAGLDAGKGRLGSDRITAVA
jgi:hypothetical protein